MKKIMLSVANDVITIGGTEMFQIYIFGEDNESLESVKERYKDYLPKKYKEEVKDTKSIITNEDVKTVMITFFINQEEKEELEDEGVLSVWSKTQKWS